VPSAVKRAYQSSLRQRQADSTRGSILQSAAALFAQVGYGGATIEAIARRARVAVPTVYAAFGSKAGLVAALRDRLLAGDAAAIALVDRDWYQALLGEPDPARQLTEFSRAVRRIHDRTALINRLIRDAAATDSQMAELWDLEKHQRRASVIPLARSLAERNALRQGLRVEAAADTLWALIGPELHELFVRDRGWSAERYERWLATTLCVVLLE
jgi:TetR/AcrR family transcriptional regulator, regulator of autoinduction and epiphytic fitness